MAKRKPKTKTSEREAQRQLMARKRAAERDIRIPPPEDPSRRERCLGDVYDFLSGYFPRTFYQSFTEDRREMVQAILHAARHSGDYALAAPRGCGKSRLALYCSLYLLLTGDCRFPLIISKNQTRANGELRTLRDKLKNESAFAADFPEVCAPIHAMGGWASTAIKQTAHGWPTQIEWSQSHLILPTIPLDVLEHWPKGMPSLAQGQIIASMGIEGPLRGLTFRDTRPDLAIIDDIDDRDTARSATETETRQQIIDQDVAGLAGPGQRISRVMLCTVINRTCIAAQYTDRKLRPPGVAKGSSCW
jgi:hypothetical protein